MLKLLPLKSACSLCNGHASGFLDVIGVGLLYIEGTAQTLPDEALWNLPSLLFRRFVGTYGLQAP